MKGGKFYPDKIGSVPTNFPLYPIQIGEPEQEFASVL